MQMNIPSPLGPADQRVVALELERLQASPGRRDPQLPGCLLAFAGMVVLTLTPALGNWVEVPRSVGVALFALAVAALFGGATIALLGGVTQDRRARRGQEAAIGAILAHVESGGDREEALRAATRLVSWARWAAAGRVTASLLDESLVRRLGQGGAELVRAVEHQLLSQQ